MTLDLQHVLSFSCDGRLFVFFNEQGLLRIWDTETNELKQEYMPNLHLSGPCTALAWVQLWKITAKKPRNSSTSHLTESLYIALGSSTGQVSLYSYAQGKIVSKLIGEGHVGKITSIAYDGAGFLYTSGADCRVIEWSLSQGEQLSHWTIGPEKPSCIVYMPVSKTLVVGARQIKVYSIARQELVQTFIGHNSDISFMTLCVVADSTEYLITCSHMERIICFWKIGKKGTTKNPTCTLLLEDVAQYITCQMDFEGNLKLASVTRSGVVHLYMIPVKSIDTEKPMKPKYTINIASDSTSDIEPISVVVASLQYVTQSTDLLIGYGDNRNIVFENIKLNFVNKIQVLVRTDPKKLCSLKSTDKRSDSNVSFKTFTPIIKTEGVEYKSYFTGHKKKVSPVEMPIELRLQNLYLGIGPVTPQPQSQVKLLVQSLHSKDSLLLHSVLSTNDIHSIKLTLQKLPVQYVTTLVNELTQIIQKKRINVEFSTNWLKILTQTHSSQLMALGNDDLLNKFGPCIGIIEHRGSCLKEFSKLNGRIQLLVSQIKRNTEEDNVNSDDVLVYEDNDSSSSDLEVSGEKSDSGDEWDEKVGDGEYNIEQNSDDAEDEDMENE